MAAERSKLEAKTKELETAQARLAERQDNYAKVEQELAGVGKALAQTEAQLALEAKHRAAAESQASELAGLRSSLEQELAQRKQAEEKLRRELDEERARLEAQAQTLAAERSKLESQTKELEAAQATVAKLGEKCAAVERQLGSVSESMAREAERRATAEGQARELAELRSSLEQELAQRKQAEEQLRRELDEKQTRLETEAQTVAEERSKLEKIQATVAELQNKCATTERQLTTVSESLAQEAERRTTAEDQARELAGLRSLLEQELAIQLAAARERDAAEQMAIRSLESQVQRALLERGRVESSLQSEADERRRLQLQSENLRATLEALSIQLKEKTGAEADWRQREAEQQACIQRLQKQITDTEATRVLLEAELRGAKEKTAELLLIQSALCAKVRELTATEASRVDSQRAMQEQLAALQRNIQDGQRELAALRYAVLDGSRLSSQVSRVHAQTIRQSAAAVAQFIAALLSSPLSPAQRRLATSLQGAHEGWMKDQMDNLCSSPLSFGAPVLQSCEFSLAEVTRDAFPVIQQTAVAADIEVQTTISGNVPERVFGDAEHIYQLITLLPESLVRLPETRQLGLQVSIEPTVPGPTGLHLRLLIAVKGTAREVCERLRAVAASSGTLQMAQLGETESGLAVCWHLAHAMGGTLQFDASTDNDVRLQVLLPVEIPSPARVSVPVTDSPTRGSEASELKRSL